MKTSISALLLLPNSYRIEAHMNQVDHLLMNHSVFSYQYKLEQSIQPVLTSIEKNGLVIANEWFTTGLQEKRNQLAHVGNEINQQIGSSNHEVVDEVALRKYWNNNDLPLANGFDELKKYKHLHPTFQLMMDYKNHKNYLKMWDERLREKGTSVDGGISIKGTWQSFASRTGRITAKNLPLTSIPVAMRDYVVSPEGYHMYSLDLNNAELRFLAHYAKCDPLVQQFNQEVDVHAETAKLIRKNLGSHEISKDESRKLAKHFTYSLLYGAGTFTIAKNMRKTFSDVTSADVGVLKDAFYQKYPELLRFLFERGEDEKLLTPFGKIKPVVEFTKTQKKNFTMQSSVSVAIKTLLAMLAKNNVTIVHVIHDEVWVLIPKDEQVERFIEKSVNDFNEKIKEIFPGLPTKTILSKEKIGGKYDE